MLRSRLRLWGLCSLIILALPLGGSAGGAGATAGRPPSILLLLTDDLDLDLHSLDYMPLTRKLLADEGATFDRYFVPDSLCCPSRATLFTGQYAHNHRVYTNNPAAGGFSTFLKLGHESASVATALHASGYRTALFGKYLNGYPRRSDPLHVPPGWDRFVSPVTGSPYEGFLYGLNEDGRLVRYGKDPQDYLTFVLADKAAQFIRSTAAGQPFFLELATYAPHKPAVPAPQHAALFPGVQAPRTPSFNEADVSDKPRAIRDLPLLDDQQIAAIDELYRHRLQSLQAVDEALASLIQTLADSGRLDDTYVFFTSDNGLHMGQHRLGAAKNTAYEEDVHLPLLVRGPGIAPGTRVAALTSEVDLPATFLALAGARPPVAGDGRSLVPLLLSAGEPADWRQTVLLEQFSFTLDAEGDADVLEPQDLPNPQGVKVFPAHIALRTADLKYVEYSDGERELYDLRADPYELDNLQRQAAPALLAELSQRARALAACAGDTCRRLEAEPPPKLAASAPASLPHRRAAF